jgi:rhamnose transport system permease protein
LKYLIAIAALRHRAANRDAGMAVLTALLFMAVTARLPQFSSWHNLKGILDDTSILILLALGEMLVILTRNIDLSLAANVALSGMSAALANQAFPALGMTALIICACALGACLGAFNGLLVWRLKIPSIVVTLGTLAIFRGFVYVISGGTWVTSNKMSAPFLAWVRLPFAGLSMLSWLALLGIVASFAMLRMTRLGRQFYAVGSNPHAAAYLGLAAGRVQFLAFTIAGAIAGLCGYLWVARFAVAYTDAAQGFELNVVAACLIGGVSIAGAVGSVTGVVLGCLFLGIIHNALPLLGISPFWQMAVSGAVITGAVILNARGGAAGARTLLAQKP